MKKRTLGLTLVIIGLSGFIFWQYKANQGLKTEMTRLREASAELEQLRLENARLSKIEADSAELAKLREQHSELLRARGEISRLRQQIKSQVTTPAVAEQAASPVAESPVQTFVANLEVELSPGHTAVTGGWKISEGKRTFLFVEPNVIDGAGNRIASENASENPATAQITVRARFADVPEAALQNLGLDKLTTQEGQSSAPLVLNETETRLLLKSLSDAGSDTLAAPRVTTLNGRQAQVSVVTEKVIDNQTFNLGPTVNVTPQLSADGKSIKLTVGALITTEAAHR